MSQKSLETYRRRYVRAGRGWKTRILDAVCEMEGWGRKHTIKVMRGKVRRHAKPRCSQNAVYGQAENSPLSVHMEIHCHLVGLVLRQTQNGLVTIDNVLKDRCLTYFSIQLDHFP